MMTFLFLTCKNVSLFQDGVCICQFCSFFYLGQLLPAVGPHVCFQVHYSPVLLRNCSTITVYISPVWGRCSAVDSACAEKVCSCCRSEPEQVTIAAVIRQHFTLSKSCGHVCQLWGGKNACKKFVSSCWYVIFYICEYPQLSCKGRVGKVEKDKVIDRSNQRNKGSLLSANLSVQLQ